MENKESQKWRTKEATQKQSYALYCSSGLDIRPILNEFSRGQLSDLIQKSNNGGLNQEAREKLVNQGATQRRQSGLSSTGNGKKSYKDIFEIVKEAVKEGKKAEKEKVKEIEKDGAKYDVIGGETALTKNGIDIKNKRKIGEMYDLCGFAWVKGISGKSRFINALKKHGEKDRLNDRWKINKDADISKSVKSGYSLSISSKRQEISVNKAIHKRALEVLKKHDFKGLKNAFVYSHLD